jgi:hypothetical protein
MGGCLLRHHSQSMFEHPRANEDFSGFAGETRVHLHLFIAD